MSNGDAGAGSETASYPTSDEPVPPAELIQLRELSVRYRLSPGLFSRAKGQDFRSVDRVSLSVRRGRTLGLVGGTGSGKSTIAKVIMGMVEPTSGSIVVAGREPAGGEQVELRRFVQVVLQDPYSSLDPRMKVGDIIAEPLTLGRQRVRGSDKTVVRARVADVLLLVGLRPNSAERFPNQFSGGQRQRIAIARALASHPELIILDEPTSALDASVKAQILNLLRTLQDELGVTFLTISHDLATVAYLASEVAVMFRGRIVEIGPTTSLFRSPRHPYTLELLGSVPGASGSFLNLPRPVDVRPESLPPSACRFAYRCALRTRLGDPARCLEEDPALVEVEQDHRTACHFPDLDEVAGLVDNGPATGSP